MLVLCLCVFLIAMIPGIWKNGGDEETEIITVELKGDTIVVNKDRVMTLDSLREYFDTLKEKGDMPGMALVCDSANPPDEALYIAVIDLMSEYGIIPDGQHRDRVKLSNATPDEIPSSFDETV